MLRTILTILQVISALAIVALVLLQRGKGADAGAGFGAGASGTVFGARGATTGLSRMTAIFAAIFMLNSLGLTYLFKRDATAAPTSTPRASSSSQRTSGKVWWVWKGAGDGTVHSSVMAPTPHGLAGAGTLRLKA